MSDRRAKPRLGVWVLVMLLAVVSTVFLSLDTTAVILTPVVVLLAQSIAVPPLPFAMMTVWLANTASLLLPVSNLTNLLAVGSIGAHQMSFLALSWAPALVGIGALGANGINNLPAYLVLEPAVSDDPVALMALLIGVNLGPLVSPWASLATLLWHQKATALGVTIGWGRFAVGGACAAIPTVALAVLALAFVAR